MLNFSAARPHSCTIMQSLSRLCGQLIVGGYRGEEPSATFLASLRRGERAGAILFKRNLPTWQAGYVASAMIADASSDEVGPVVAVDQEGGRVQRFGSPVLRLPPMRQLAQRADETLVAEVAETLGLQLRQLGFNVNFAPVLDVDTNPANPVIGDRSFSSDANVVARFGVAFALGLQAAGVAACGKHFPGHGDTTIDSHLDLPTVDTSPQRMQQVEFIPFYAAIEAGIDALMTAHIVVRQVDSERPATMSPTMVRGWLREQMGFRGVVFSDDLEMRAIAGRMEIGQAAVQAVRAGCDVLLICKREDWQDEAHASLVREAESSQEFRGYCEQAVARCRALRARRPRKAAPHWRQIDFASAAGLQRRLDQLIDGSARRR